VAEDEAETTEETPEEEAPRPKKRTRRGSRGGRRRKKKPAETTTEGTAATDESEKNGRPDEAPVLIHLPEPALGEEEPVAAEGQPETDGSEQPKPKKRTRRGSRGGRRRRKPAAQANGDAAQGQSEKAEEPLVD
jgi:ribonuclease E